MDTVLAWVAALFAALGGLVGLGEEPHRYYGYVEGEYVYAAPDSGGLVETVAVDEGERVAAGAGLFTLDAARADEAVAAAEARLGAARASLRDLKSGSRAAEIEVIEQQRSAALDILQLARETYDRTMALRLSGVVPESKVDADEAALATARAEVQRLEAELRVARLPAREARIEAARHEVAAAEAELARAKTDRARRSVAAPVAGRVERVFLDAGEYAAAGAPVVSLLPDDGIRIRFFVPEPERPQIAVGDAVAVDCTSCAAPLAATVSFLASEAEHTPPVIYSREERAKLVFAVEAKFAEPAALLPGQPVDVSPAP